MNAFQFQGGGALTSVALTLAAINEASANPSPMLGFASTGPNPVERQKGRTMTYYDEMAARAGVKDLHEVDPIADLKDLADELEIIIDEPAEEDLSTGYVR